MKTCQKLTSFTINGSGAIGDTLSAALPFAASLTSITIAKNREISYAAVVGILNHCKNTLLDATFLCVTSRSGPSLLTLERLRSLDMRPIESKVLVSQSVLLFKDMKRSACMCLLTEIRSLLSSAMPHWPLGSQTSRL